MKNFILTPTTDKQKGSALLLFVFALLFTGITIIITNLPKNINVKQQNQTTLALSKARQALIAYAVSNYYRTNLNTREILAGWHGYLPCPETTSGSEGTQDANCNAFRINALGRLPWKTLNIEPLKDSSGQCLWYAVSAAYKFGPKQLHNADSLGMFDIYNTQGQKLNSDVPEDRIVAIVLAPGPQLSGQNRSIQNSALPCGNLQSSIHAGDYLDTINNINNALISNDTDQIDSFAGLQSNISLLMFNDRFITITRGDIFAAITTQTKTSRPPSEVQVNALDHQLLNLGSILAQCLVTYAQTGSLKFPRPAAVDLNLNTITDDYRNSRNYIDSVNHINGYLGRLPIVLTHSNLLTSQSRTFLIDYCPQQLLTAAHIRLWNDWKDHFFFVIGRDFSPDSLQLTATCTSTSCPSVAGQNFAALIIFANDAITDNQIYQLRRDSDIEPQEQNPSDLKGNIANYLEGVNATNFGTQSLGSYSLTAGNDIFIGIDVNMNITCFNPDSNLAAISCPNL